jgi:hypothetical protein
MAQMISRQPLTAEVWLQSPACTYAVGEVAMGQDFLPVFQFCPVSIIPLLLHTHHLHVALPRRA